MIFGSSDWLVLGLSTAHGQADLELQTFAPRINVSPLVVGDIMYIAQGEENVTDVRMGAVAAVNLKGPRATSPTKRAPAVATTGL